MLHIGLSTCEGRAVPPVDEIGHFLDLADDSSLTIDRFSGTLLLWPVASRERPTDRLCTQPTPRERPTGPLTCAHVMFAPTSRPSERQPATQQSDWQALSFI